MLLESLYLGLLGEESKVAAAERFLKKSLISQTPLVIEAVQIQVLNFDFSYRPEDYIIEISLASSYLAVFGFNECFGRVRNAKKSRLC